MVSRGDGKGRGGAEMNAIDQMLVIRSQNPRLGVTHSPKIQNIQKLTLPERYPVSTYVHSRTMNRPASEVDKLSEQKAS